MRSGAMHDEIVEALRSAFPDPGDMSLVVNSADIGVSFDDYRVALNITYPQAISALIRNYADPQDHLYALLKAAQKRNPKNPRLAKVTSLLADLEDRFARLRPDRPLRDAESLVLKGVDFENIAVWIEGLATKRRSVCRIEPQPPKQSMIGFGTGFLVARDVVVTNFHVASSFWDDASSASRVVLRFDYETDSSGVAVGNGTEHRLATGWRGRGKPTEEQESRPWQVLCSSDLDFALLRLEQTAAEDQIGGAQRGFLTPVPAKLNEHDPVVILQHPNAAPLKIMMGAVDSIQPPHHVLYRVNTERGSSGSPCLNQRLETAALHHWSLTENNRGVLFKSILGDLAERREILKSQGLEQLIS